MLADGRPETIDDYDRVGCKDSGPPGRSHHLPIGEPMVELACLGFVWVALNVVDKWRTRENLGDLIVWPVAAILFVAPAWIAAAWCL